VWYGWFAVFLHMCLNHTGKIRTYWHSINGHNWVQESQFSRTAFLDIYNTMWHIRDECLDLMEQYLVSSYNYYWIPSMRICLDETMRKFKGRSKHKVFQPNKPVKRGLKYYMAVDESNYCLYFTLYKNNKDKELE